MTDTGTTPVVNDPIGAQIDNQIRASLGAPGTGLQTGSLSVGSDARELAKHIALGLVAQPTSADGWREFLNQYGGIQPAPTPPTPSQPAVGTLNKPYIGAIGVTNPTSIPGPDGHPSNTSGPDGIDAFMAAVRHQESGGNYNWGTEVSPTGARGAYQFEPGTWTSEATAAGVNPDDTSVQAQDTVARYYMTQLYNQYGNWRDVAEAWYGGPGAVGTNEGSGSTAGPTVQQYANEVMSGMQTASNQPMSYAPSGSYGSSQAVMAAQSQLGVPYVWGGESPGQALDCSGLVQWSYKQEGINLPRGAQDQYNVTQKIPTSDMQPGDLVFFGGGPQDIQHVGIYVGGGQMIDAPHTGADVRTENYDWSDFVGATRPAGVAQQAPAPTTGQASLQPAAASLSAIARQVQQAMNSLGVK